MSNMCPICKDCGLVVITSKNLKICDCGYSEPHILKPNKKSILEDKVGVDTSRIDIIGRNGNDGLHY